MKTSLAVAILVVLLAPVLHGQDRSLHLAIGDPARKDREAPVVLDGITDTRTGEVITPAELPKRLAGARLVLVGESHTDMDFHRPELRVVEELARPAGRCSWGSRCTPTRAAVPRRLGGRPAHRGGLPRDFALV